MGVARSRLDGSHKVVLDSGSEPSRTKQSMKQECDINVIMGRYLKTGQIDHLNVHGPNYGFASSQTFQECMEIVRTAEQMFADLPSETRARFQNRPGAFLDFVQDPKNVPEMVRMGLAKVAPPPVVAADLPAASAAPIPSSTSSAPPPPPGGGTQ